MKRTKLVIVALVAAILLLGIVAVASAQGCPTSLDVQAAWLNYQRVSSLYPAQATITQVNDAYANYDALRYSAQTCNRAAPRPKPTPVPAKRSWSWFW